MNEINYWETFNIVLESILTQCAEYAVIVESETRSENRQVSVTEIANGYTFCRCQ